MRRIIILILLLVITGCSSDKSFICKMDIENDIQDYKLDGTYTIYYKDSYVTKIEKIEKYNSTNQDTLDYLDEYLNLDYENLNRKYNGYTYDVLLSEDYVRLESVIDMNLVDVKKMKKDNYIEEDYVIGENITTSGIKYFYEQKGAICEE